MIKAGQLRTWKDQYFKLTRPSEGYEMFLVISQTPKGWNVMYNGGALIEMTQDSIEDLTKVLSNAEW